MRAVLLLFLLAAQATFSQGASGAPGWWSRATLLYDQERFAEAGAAFAHFVELSPKPAPAFAFLALCEYETHNYERSMAHFREWARLGSPGTKQLIAVAVFHWALLLTRKGQFEQALHLLNGGAKGGESSPALIEALGLAGLQMGYLPEEYPPDRRELIYQAGKVELEAALRHSEQAEAESRKLLRHYSQTAGVHYLLGTRFLQDHDEEAAAREFRQELEIAPKNVNAVIQFAIYYLGKFEPAQALPLAERAVALAPGYFPAHHTLGQALLELKRFNESVRELEIARRLAPQNPYIRLALSKAYAGLGNTAGAERERNIFASLKEKEHRMQEQEAGAK